jgi:soluble lytic murein transglycosylase-like protein
MTKLNIRSISGIVAAEFAFAVMPLCLMSQTSSLVRQAHSGQHQPFAGFDDALTTQADAILASATQTSSPAASTIVFEATTSTVPDLQWSSAVVKSGWSAAELRLSLLRPAVDPILQSHGVPTNLAAVILVESSARASAVSSKGARGLWQLMPETARRYGLRVNENEDDRLDLFKSTDAAARYLHDLYAQFSDWKLALAAYNTGESNVGAAMLRAHTHDFDQLTNLRQLPLETINYVPRVLAMSKFFGQSSFSESAERSNAIHVFAVSTP